MREHFKDIVGILEEGQSEVIIPANRRADHHVIIVGETEPSTEVVSFSIRLKGSLVFEPLIDPTTLQQQVMNLSDPYRSFLVEGVLVSEFRVSRFSGTPKGLTVLLKQANR